MPSPDLTKPRWWILPATLPTDGWTVYVRPHRTSPAVEATWSLSAGTFTPSTLPAIPWYDCFMWRILTWPFIR